MPLKGVRACVCVRCARARARVCVCVCVCVRACVCLLVCAYFFGLPTPAFPHCCSLLTAGCVYSPFGESTAGSQSRAQLIPYPITTEFDESLGEALCVVTLADGPDAESSIDFLEVCLSGQGVRV